MHDARLMACSYEIETHVVAIFRHDVHVGGRVAFRKYDNDSDARRRGTYEMTSARRLWTRCTMAAITTDGSGLHRAVDPFNARRCSLAARVDLTSPPRPTRARAPARA